MKRIINTILSLTFCLLMQAQIPQAPKNLQSPNAASLGLYGEVPVSLFTGVPEISIPLFKASDNYKNFSIALSYHAGGVHPDQHPGWVGENWSLFAGGNITRTVKCWPDELNKITIGGDCHNYGYYFNHNSLNNTAWNTKSFLDNVIIDKDAMKKDMEPDEFSFNFAGYNGSFYLNSNGQWIVKCNKAVKVIFDNTFLDVPIVLHYGDASIDGHLQSFSGFTIITEDGVKYTFGGDNTSIEYSMGFFNEDQNMWVANSWCLKKITYPNGNSVDFSYKRSSYVCQMYMYFYESSVYVAEVAPYGLFSNFLTQTCTGATHPFNINDTYNGTLIYPTYLSNINSKDFNIDFHTSISNELKYRYGEIVQPKLPADSSYYLCQKFPYLFHYNDVRNDVCITSEWSGFNTLLNWEKLDSITISTSSGVLYKNISFKYNNKQTERLFLDSVNVGNQKYTFSYYNRNLLPDYLENKLDHWGFYNNRYAYPNYLSYYYDRETNSIGEVQKYGILNKITYPTGGYTEFVFEPNQYSTQLKPNRWDGCYTPLDVSVITGGLRIKKIINYPENNQEQTTKEYFYTKNFSLNNKDDISSGVLGGTIAYSFNNYQINFVDINTNPVATAYLNKFTSTSVLPMCNNTDNHIGYTEVVELNSNNSYTKYTFSNFDNGFLDEKYEFTYQYPNSSPYNSKAQERGNLLSKVEFDNLDSPKYKETNNYIKQSTNSEFVKSFSSTMEALCYTYYIQYCTAYKLYTYSMLLGSKKEVFYNNTDSLVKETKFKYDTNFPIVVNQTEKDSHGDSITTVYTYPFHIEKNYLANAPATSNTLGSRSISTTLYSNCRNMYNLNFLNSPVESTTYKNTKVIDSKLFYYGRHGNDYLPDSTYSLETTSALNTFMRYCDPNVGPGPYLIDGRYEKSPSLSYKYDSQSNIIQITQNHGISTVYLWSYNGQYPIAEIKNATYAEVITKIDENYIKSMSERATPTNQDFAYIYALRSSLPNAQITYYTFKPLVGILTKTDPRGVTTTYTYDTFNRLQYIKDTNGKILNNFDYNYKH